MRSTALRTPVRHTDPDGASITLIPLTNSDLPAKVLTSDFDRLIAEGVSTQWFLNSNGCGRRYVRACKGSSRPNMISRLVIKAPKGTTVAHRDGSTLNLRRDNLKCVRSHKRRCSVKGSGPNV
jgi:hypothetical protein